MAPRLALHMITWGDHLTQFLDDAAALGAFAGVETFATVVERFRGREAEFDAELKRRGLRLVALYGGGALQDPAERARLMEWNLDLARFVRDRGANNLVFGPPARGARDRALSHGEFRHLADALNLLGERCLAMGVRLGIHPHLGTLIETEAEVSLALGLTDPAVVFFAPDVAHLAGAGMNPGDLIRAYGERVTYLHLKDLTPAARRASDPAAPVFCELGEGIVDLGDVAAALREIHFEGWAALELDASPRGARASVEISLRHLRARLPEFLNS